MLIRTPAVADLLLAYNDFEKPIGERLAGEALLAEFATAQLDDAVRALSDGLAVAFPTDTVVGLGVSVEAASSPEAIFAIKQRDEGKPIAWLVSDVADLERYGRDVPPHALELARRFWPGPLTIIVRASERVSAAFCGPDGSIGLRMPASDTALALIGAVGCPLATSSANIAGCPAPARVADLDPRISQAVACVFSGEGDFAAAASASGEASTIVSFVDGAVRLVREGAISMDDINKAATPTPAPSAPYAVQPIREEFSFPSADGASTIHACWWLPAQAESPNSPAKPRAVVQFIHGMAEHIARYDRFASILTAQGFAVCGHDHIGHGRSVSSPEEFGCLPAKQGASVMVADAQRLRLFAAERFPDLKHFVFGHSMGSFVARSLVSKHGQGLAGAIICGTGNQPLALSKAGNALANLLCLLRGPRSTSSLIHNMAVGAYSKAIEGAKTPNDWLSHDEEVIKSYGVDPLCGYMFSVSGYTALTSLTAEVVTPACAAGVPKDLPLLYIAGEQDPVGDCGKGVRAAVELVRSAGVRDVELIMYADMRHEILNEFGKEKVYADVLGWLEGRLS